MLQRVTVIALGLMIVATAPALAQNPLSQGALGSYSMVKGYVTRSAEMVPQEDYDYQPTPEVRTFGELFAHIADASFSICAGAAGEAPPRSGIEGGVSGKAALQEALAEGFGYCDGVYEGMTDAVGAETVPFFGGQQMPKLSVLEFNTHHTFEHYGNIITYMRLRGMVPPSSMPQQ